VIAEAKELAADGVKELIIIAQDTTSYGKDLEGRKAKEGLAGLLKKMAEVEGVEWIRVLYGHPASVSDELLDVFVEEHKIVKYLDIPLQHISDNVLDAMKRKTGRRETEELIERIRRRVPGIALRTSMIVGFPGETEKDFNELVDFVKHARFERLGVFRYSREPGTRAAELPGQVPDDVKAARFNELSELQEKIMVEYHKSLAGEIVPVIIDSDAGEGSKAVGRTFADAPDIDPVILLEGANIDAGKTGLARIAGQAGPDLTGKFIES
jgi:ribosomal protein S12 methylthiotransferase